MNSYLFCSLYYRRNIVTGANKRFENFIYYFQKHIKEKEKIIVVVKKGHLPDKLLKSKLIKFIEIPKFNICDRFFSYIFLTVKFLSLKRMVVQSDFMPIPLIGLSKHKHYQLVHDLRNFTKYSRNNMSFFQKIQWRNCRKIITVSDFTKNELMNKCGIKEKNIFISPNGLNPMYYLKNDKTQYKYDILYIATFEKRKNHLFLIEALSFYKGKKTIRICFIGRDLGCRNMIEKKYKELKNNIKIDFIESVDKEEDIIKIYDESKIFVFPSLYEGFGMPLIEAVSRGCRVLCSDIRIFREIGGDISKFFNFKSPQNLMTLIEEELTMKAIKNKIVSDFILDYKWEKITKDFYVDSKND